MNRKEQKSISSHLIKSYMLLFPFFIFLIILVVALGTFLSQQWLEASMPCIQYPASKFIQPDINKIDISEVLLHGGSSAVVDKNGNITQLGGTQFFDAEQLTMQEWTDFLTLVSDYSGAYYYSVAYEEQGEFWLVVGFPISIRVQISFASNPQSTQYGKAVLFFSSLVIALLLLLFFGTFVYAKISARAFITPLRQLCGMVKRMIHGNYNKEELSNNFSGEFLWLKNDVSRLSSTLEEEKALREQVEQDKKRMLLDISHELRNPLATVMGYAETLHSDETLDLEKKQSYAQVIWKNSIRANARLDDLFTYSKLEHPDFKLSFKEVDICEFMREQISLFYADFEAAGIITDFFIPEQEILLSFDEKLMARVFSNLFTNSIRYNKAGVQLTVSLTSVTDFVEIVLADNGIGMEKEIAINIFNPFTRGGKARNSETGGSGLGLAIAKKVIDAHHGSIRLLTEPGKGCIFTVQLNFSLSPCLTK